MTPKDKANEIVKKMFHNLNVKIDINRVNEAKQCALIAVDEIINSNPHSNPLNTDVYSTMSYWQEVKNEINNL